MSSVVRKTITDKQAQWVESQLAGGGYTNGSEFFCALLRKEQERKESFNTLQAAIDEGIASGISDSTFDGIWAEGLKQNAGG